MSPPVTPAPKTPDGAPEVLSVSRLNGTARALLESGMGSVWVEGEMSNFARPASGHWYFSLKDANAQVRCAMWRARSALSRCHPREGLQVLVRARVSLYEPRGDYQLIVEHMEEAGLGALQRAFEELKSRLQKEGLFDPGRKRPLPAAPRRIGVITSPTGAALRDILHIMQRRFPATGVLIYPVPVQGAAAAPALIAALDLANARRECEVLIVARGGGSLEDLWAFNDEGVARAIHRSALPVVTGIGHEVDFTIADFTADVRAPTPSGAAQLVTPDRQVFVDGFQRLLQRALAAMQRQLQRSGQLAELAAQRLARAHPGARMAQQTQRIDELEQRLQAALARLLARCESELQATVRALDAVSPMATLSRGYAIVTRVEDGVLVSSADGVRADDEIQARLARGRLRARVLAVEPG
jgi:exodeoxyribonuclease VII large subunit